MVKEIEAPIGKALAREDADRQSCPHDFISILDVNWDVLTCQRLLFRPFAGVMLMLDMNWRDSGLVDFACVLKYLSKLDDDIIWNALVTKMGGDVSFDGGYEYVIKDLVDEIFCSR